MSQKKKENVIISVSYIVKSDEDGTALTNNHKCEIAS